MADGLLGGTGDFFLNRGKYADPNAINPQYGVPESDVRQAGINTLANVSSLLLAAGQPMTGAQRAQLLAGVGPALGGMQTDIFKSTQARLMTAQQRDKMQEMRELQALDEERKRDPEGFAKKFNIPQSQVGLFSLRELRDIAKNTIVRQAAKTLEERRLEAAQAQVAERKLREPTIFRVGNQAYRFDEKGETVRIGPAVDYGFGDTETPSRPPPGVGVAPPDVARPAGAPPIPQQAAETNRFATINRGIDYNRAFGLEGLFNWGAGKLRGLVGSEDKETQEGGKAISEVNTLRNSLISATSAEVAGRNLKATQQRIQELLPTPAALFTSPAEAVNKLSSIKSLIESDMNDLLFIGSERSNASPSDKTKAAQAYRDLRRNRDNINVIVDSLTKGGPPQAGTQAQGQGAARFREGQTAINRQTGARVIYRNGRWEPL